MNLAQVIGRVVSSQKDASLEGLTMLMLAVAGPDGKASGATVVAVDAVGAGDGEYVLYAAGSSARQTAVTEGKPVDAVVMAIVDSWDIGGELRYKKGSAG